jgi:hypothetical protein
MTSGNWPQDWEISIQLNLERAHSFVYTLVGTGIENTCYGCQHLPLRHIHDLCLFAITILSLYHVRERQRLWTHVLLTGRIHLGVRVVTQISASLQFLPPELDFLKRRFFVHMNFAQWHLAFGTQALTLPDGRLYLAKGAGEVKLVTVKFLWTKVPCTLGW